MKFKPFFTLPFLSLSLTSFVIAQDQAFTLSELGSRPIVHEATTPNGKLEYERIHALNLDSSINYICSQKTARNKPAIIFDTDILIDHRQDISKLIEKLQRANVAYFASSFTDNPEEALEQIRQHHLDEELEAYGELKEANITSPKYGSDLHLSKTGRVAFVASQPHRSGLYDAWVVLPFLVHPAPNFTSLYFILKNNAEAKTFSFIEKQVEIAQKLTLFTNKKLNFIYFNGEEQKKPKSEKNTSKRINRYVKQDKNCDDGEPIIFEIEL